MRKILVLRGGALGDLIVTLPALALLRGRWPQAQIELVGNVRAAEIGRSRGLLNTVHSQHERRWSELFGAGPLTETFHGWLSEFDLVVNYWPDSDGELARRFPVHAGQEFISASAMPQTAPAAAHYCAPLRRLGLEPGELCYRLLASRHAPAKDVSMAEASAAIAVHPGSGSPRKNWPAANWLELFQELPTPVSIIVGEAESEKWIHGAAAAVASNEAAMGTPLRRLLVQRPLEEVIAELSRCRLFVGHDSGISHLAAGCGTPCVLLFGPTDPAIWAPPAANVRVLRRGDDLSSISVDDVRDAVAAMLPDRR
jgi:heptosyltransferase-2